MGYSKAQKTKTHERIVKLASKRFREVGLARIGIAELMKEAGRSLQANSGLSSGHISLSSVAPHIS